MNDQKIENAWQLIDKNKRTILVIFALIITSLFLIVAIGGVLLKRGGRIKTDEQGFHILTKEPKIKKPEIEKPKSENYDKITSLDTEIVDRPKEISKVVKLVKVRVKSNGGANIREEPYIDSKFIVTAQYGSLLSWTGQRSSFTNTFIIGRKKIKDYWYEIKIGDKNRWVFGGCIGH